MDETAARKAFMDGLVAEGYFIPTSIPGLVGRTAKFEDLVTGFGRIIDAYSREDGAERIYFPPLVPRSTLERAGYLESMPHLAGTVHSFCGKDAEHKELLAKLSAGDDWGDCLEMTDVALAPAACYPLYPTCKGTLAQGGRLVDLSASYVFRREPSDDPARLQMFRQREIVRVGSPDEVMQWREVWLDRGFELLRSLGLEAKVDEASDPFFGRGGRMMAATQRQQKLKFEILVPICSEEKPTALTSFNYHRSHFGETFDIRTHDAEHAHTACLGFGAERVTLALIKRHGFDLASWPDSVRSRLLP